MKLQIINLFHRFWPLGILIFGLFSLFSPFFDGISEVCCPNLWRYRLNPIFFFAEIFLPFLAIAYVIIGLANFVRNPLGAVGVKFAVPFISLLIVWGIISVSGLHRIHFFPIGGELRLRLVDKPEKIRLSAIELLLTTTENELRSVDLPKNLDSLLITHAEMDREFNIVNAHIFTHGLFGAQGDFGYLFQAETSPLEKYSFDGARGYRFWQLQEGIYFYQKW